MSARFEAELRKRIGEELERLASELAAGLAVKDYAQYQNYVGRIGALNTVLAEYIDDVNTAINKD